MPLTHKETPPWLRMFFEPHLNDATLMDEIRTLVKAYDTIFGRTPDVPGFDFWIEKFRELRDGDGEIRDDVSNILGHYFSQSPEYQSLFPAGTSNDQFLTDLYTNQFNRAPDQAGFNFWLNLLKSGEINRNDVISHFVTSEEYETQEGARIGQSILDLITQKLASFAPDETPSDPGKPAALTYADDQNTTSDQKQTEPESPPDGNAKSNINIPFILDRDSLIELPEKPYPDDSEEETSPLGTLYEAGSLFHDSLFHGFSFYDFYGVPEGDFDALKEVAPESIFLAPEGYKPPEEYADLPVVDLPPGYFDPLTGYKDVDLSEMPGVIWHYTNEEGSAETENTSLTQNAPLMFDPDLIVSKEEYYALHPELTDPQPAQPQSTVVGTLYEAGSLFHDSLFREFSFYDFYGVPEGDFDALKEVAPESIFLASEGKSASDRDPSIPVVHYFPEYFDPLTGYKDVDISEMPGVIWHSANEEGGVESTDIVGITTHMPADIYA